MKITIEGYEKRYSIKMPDSSTSTQVIYEFCQLLRAYGYSESSIAELFNDEDGSQGNSPFQWNVE